MTFEKSIGRKSWLDLGRGISILLVILFHSENTVAVTGFHWTTLAAPFRMPLFFFISGYLFTSDRSSFSISKKLSQIFRGIVIPYLIFTSILVVPKTLFHDMSLEEGLREIFMGWASWFVVALCGAQIIFSVSLYCTKKIILLLILSLCLIGIGIWIHSIYPYRLPFYVNYSLLIAPFFFAGFIYRIYEYRIEHFIKQKWIIIALIVLYLAIIIYDITFLKTDLSLFNDRLTTYRNIFLSLAYSFLGVFIMVTLLKITPRIPFIEYIGKNSLIFYYLNGACLKLLKAITGILKFDLTEIPKYAYVLIFLIITTITIYFLSRLIRKYCPLLVGDKNAFNSFKTYFREQPKNKISSTDFRYIDLTRSVLIFLVVMIHIPIYSHFTAFDYFLNLVPHGICHIAVPSFFLISGYLFKPDYSQPEVFKHKYYNRMFSLGVPYIIWNILAILVFIIPHLDIYSNITITNSLALFWNTSQSFIHTTGTSPIDYPLWYIRDLMVCLILFPIIYILIKHLSWILPMILVFLWISGYNLIGISLISISFFTIGYWLRVTNFDLFFKNKTTTILTIGSITCLILNLFLNNPQIFRIGICCGVLSILTIIKWIFYYNSKFAKIFIKLFTPSFVFFVYCVHALYLSYLGNYIYKCFFDFFGFIENSLTAFIYYFTTFFLTIVIAYLLFKTINILFPNAVKILTGNRIQNIHTQSQ